MTPSEAKQEIISLTEHLNQARELYYQGGQSPLEDDQYDYSLSQLEELEQKFPALKQANSPTSAVGAAPSGEYVNVKHQTPMYSLANTFKKEDFLKAIARCEEDLGKALEYIVELKIDGLSMSLIYEKGEFVQAITRGNGEVGDDVTASVRTIKTLPLTLKEPLDLELRGEVYLEEGRFKELNVKREAEGLELYMNPRNAAAGAIRLKDPKQAAEVGLSLWVYDAAQGVDTSLHSELLGSLEELGFPVNPDHLVSGDHEEMFAYCKQWEDEKREALSFPIDGMVVKVNPKEDQKWLGFVDKYPKWAFAWKFKEEVQETTLLKVENSIGRTGMITPVAHVAPVNIARSIVQRASLHNYEQVATLGIRIGDQVKIAKKGEIIPQILGVVIEKRPTDTQEIAPPTHCPSCGEELTRPDRKLISKKKRLEGKIEKEKDLYCFNPLCPAQLLARLEHFTSRAAMDIREIGPAFIETLVSQKMIGSIADLFRLKEHQDELKQLEGYGEKSVEKVLASLERSKTVNLNQFLFALGIRQIGKTAAKTIAYQVTSIADLMALSAEKIEKFPDFGEIMQNSMKEWLALQENQDLLQELIDLGVTPIPLEKPSTQPFKGQIVVITGSLSKGRREWQYDLEQVGFKVSAAVSSKTTYLLAGENAGSKAKKAEEKGVPVRTEEEMQELIKSKA